MNRKLWLMSLIGAALTGAVVTAASSSCTPAKNPSSGSSGEGAGEGDDSTGAAEALGGGSSPSGSNTSSAMTKTNSALEEAPPIGSLADLMDGSTMWGMSLSALTDAYNKSGGVFDQAYAPILSKMTPGSKMQMVEADVQNRKSAFARSTVRFESDPTGFDNQPIHTEYTYKNDESMQWAQRLNMKQYFFFFGATGSERLWKIYDEIPLIDGGPFGATFQEATQKMAQWLGGPGHGLDAGADPTIEWKGAKTHIRAIDRSDADHVIGVVFEDQATLGQLKTLRKNSPEDSFAIDSTTQAVTKHGVSDPNAAHKDGGPKI
jgi:hypothetical protein